MTPPATTATADLDFLELPAVALIDVPLDQMTDSQLEAMLAELNTLCNQPGAQRRRLNDEATEIKTKTPRVAKKRPLML